MKKALQYILPVLLSALLIWYLFRKVDFRHTMEIISHGVDYWWILAAMGLSVFSHIFRAMRWRLQLDALHVRSGLMELTCAVFGCYALNLLLPRIGEIWRCTFVSKRSRTQFTTVMGSMVADRMADSVMVLLLILLTFVLAAPALAAFMAKYPVGEDMLRLLYNPFVWVSVSAVAVIAWWLLRRFRETPMVRTLGKWTGEIWRGFAVTATMPGRWRFVFLTIAIWGCYFVQLYVAFYAFGFTRELCSQPGLAYGLLPCLVAFVFSSIGMAVPSNGGLGPWNIAVMFGLAIYGVADVEGAAFSILQWSGQTVMLIVLGIFTAIWTGATSGRGEEHYKLNQKNEIR
ncbi:MAG: flippase-like domain-containing protein [Muribaculaceae bacterium]|nr:flippase-like domain-containing protein [Muribaculaceae bacterium]